MKRAVFLLFLAVIFSNVSFAEKNTGNLIVKVYNEEYKQILPGAVVTIQSSVSKESEKKGTNFVGKAVFRNLAIDNYNVIVEMDGFQTSNTVYVQLVPNKTIITEVKLLLGKASSVCECCVIGTGPLVDIIIGGSEEEASRFLFFEYIENIPANKKYNAIKRLSIEKFFKKSSPGNLIVVVLTDEGQSLPGANVTIQSTVLMGTRSQTTSSNGWAVFRNLPPGDFRIEIDRDGFQRLLTVGIPIQANQTTKVVEELRVGNKNVDWSTCVRGISPIIDVTRSSYVHEYEMITVRRLPCGE